MRFREIVGKRPIPEDQDAPFIEDASAETAKAARHYQAKLRALKDTRSNIIADKPKNAADRLRSNAEKVVAAKATYQRSLSAANKLTPQPF